MTIQMSHFALVWKPSKRGLGIERLQCLKQSMVRDEDVSK